MTLNPAYGPAPAAGVGGIDFSETEQDTGLKWTDDSAIFQKVLDLGVFPNAVLKNVAHGITGIDRVVSLTGMGRVTTGEIRHAMPFVQTAGLDGLGFSMDDTNVSIQPGTLDRSNLSGFAIILYTKT